MLAPIELLLLGISILLLLAILAGKASGRVGVPALAAFLALGMLAGSDGLGGIYFDNPWLTLAGRDGGAGLHPRRRPGNAGALSGSGAGAGLALSTLGVALTTLLVGAFAIVVLRFSLLEGFLLGAIVSSTDAAAVFRFCARAIRA